LTLPAFVPALLLLGTPAATGAGASPVAIVQVTPPPVVPTVSAPTSEQSASDDARAVQIPVAEQSAGGRRRHAPGDPLEKFNRTMFARFQSFDREFFRPVAIGYAHVVPKPVRGGLRHFFSNLGEPLVALNYLLQFKPGKAAETLGRFVVNSTLGIGGLIDVAKTHDFRLPHRPNSFGNTLAIYGVKPGPYLFLPVLGPTTLRDLVGGQAEGFVYPLAIGKPFDRLEYQIPHAVLTGLDQRAESDADLQALYAGSVDPYASLRSSYLQDRQGEIDHIRGKSARHAAPELDDPLADPAGGAGAAPTTSSTSELSDPLADPAANAPPPSSVPPRAASSPDTSDPLADPAALTPKP
jgi:phospholipid-binding lipoprotein MlaA